MKTTRIVLVSSTFFSILFSCIYLLFFSCSIPLKEQNMTLYMNQIGLYKEKENALNMINALYENGIEAYIFKNDDCYSVVSGIGEEIDKENEDKLKQLSYSYVIKKIQLKDKETITYAKKGNYKKVLELIQD